MIETKRTYIREFVESDAKAVLTLNSNELVTRFTGDSHAVKTQLDAKNIIKNIWLDEYHKYGYGRWAVVDKASGHLVGFCGFKFHRQLAMPDIGYRFLPEYWGKGYASETSKACVKYGQESLSIERFFGDVMKQNIPSVIVLRKLGLKFNCFVKIEELNYMRFSLDSRTMLNTSQFYK